MLLGSPGCQWSGCSGGRSGVSLTPLTPSQSSSSVLNITSHSLSEGQRAAGRPSVHSDEGVKSD